MDARELRVLNCTLRPTASRCARRGLRSVADVSVGVGPQWSLCICIGMAGLMVTSRVCARNASSSPSPSWHSDLPCTCRYPGYPHW